MLLLEKGKDIKSVIYATTLTSSKIEKQTINNMNKRRKNNSGKQ